MPANWWVTKDGDIDCLELHARHYSQYQYADGRERRLFVGPGDKLVLRTEPGNACFVWRNFTDDCIDQRTGRPQEGVNCAVFRNEGEHLSSSLVVAADAIADAVWTDRRHYTPTSIAKRSPQRTLDIASSWPAGVDAVSQQAANSCSNELQPEARALIRAAASMGSRTKEPAAPSPEA